MHTVSFRFSGAMNDAAEGEFGSAVSTLNTAISLIRQSKISGDEACRSLIRTLEARILLFFRY
jgi:cleavage and polyadenylation specificity factor subunit 6/7